MSTLALYPFELESFKPYKMMGKDVEEDDIFMTSYQRCHPVSDVTENAASPSCGRSSGRSSVRSESSSGQEDLITLSYNLLNHIHRHEQSRCDERDLSVDSSSSPGNSCTVRSISADSSEACLLKDFEENVLGDTIDQSTILSPISSVDSSGFHSDYSVCDSKTEKGGKEPTLPNGKPLYTAELQVLCRICGDRASGFHYGVHSCEGCKGFFRRTLKKQLVYKPCKENLQCRIDTGTRNKCQYCRYQKCLNAGMSPNAVRFGRMPKAEREKLMADREELSSSCTARILELRSLSDCIKSVFQDAFSSCKHVSNYLATSNKKDPVVKVKTDPDDVCCLHTCSATEFKERELFKSFQAAFLPVIEGTVKFMKKIPNVSKLDMADRISLLKQNCYGVSLILSFMMYDCGSLLLEGETTQLLLKQMSNQYECYEAQCLFDGLFKVAKKLRNLDLTTVEVALFCSIVLLLEAPGLQEADKVETLQLELIDSFRLELKHNHPKDKHLLPRMLLIIPQLIQIAEEFKSNNVDHLFDDSDNYSNTHELLCEILDLH